jgi:hypothetical protein
MTRSRQSSTSGRGTGLVAVQALSTTAATQAVTLRESPVERPGWRWTRAMQCLEHLGGRPAMIMFDPLYLVMLLPAILLSAWAAWMTQARFAKWSRVANTRGMTGAAVARYILDRNGLQNVSVVPEPGTSLSDHYDPRDHVVRLSEAVYYQGSVSAMAVAAHETGHAIQHARGY